MFLLCSQSHFMRKPTSPERLYLDFDGFFASVEQTARPGLRGLPVGVVPFAGAGDRGIIIACSREAKLAGVGSLMTVRDARAVCPSIVTVPQSPDLYRRAHNALIAEIGTVIPIDAVKSIDELTCRLVGYERDDPRELGARIKTKLAKVFGPYLTCSIGYAGNRQLAKMACKAGKRSVIGVYGDGNELWHPQAMPGPLLTQKLSDIPGVGERMKQRLYAAGIYELEHLLSAAPKQVRALWRNVTGERLWYALHGFDLQTPTGTRGMYGHGRVLSPDVRTPSAAYEIARLLTVKAARRLREDKWYAGGFFLFVGNYKSGWQGVHKMQPAFDDKAALTALSVLWAEALKVLRPPFNRVHVTLLDLSAVSSRQLDLLDNDDAERTRWEKLSVAVDSLNHRYGRTLVSIGPWPQKRGDYIGGKISFTRIPRAADFL
jgi:DNA polymerase-4